MSEVPPIALVPVVPRFERIGAGLLLAVYGAVWALTVGVGGLPWIICRLMLVAVGKFVSQIRAGASIFDKLVIETGVNGLIAGLYLATLVLALQALLRCCGRSGFLGGRTFWVWSAGHAMAILGAFFASFALIFIRYSQFPMDWMSYFFVGFFSAELIISAAMLRRTRRHE